MFYCSGTVIGEWTAGVPAGEQKPKDGAQKTNRYTHGEREMVISAGGQNRL